MTYYDIKLDEDKVGCDQGLSENVDCTIQLKDSIILVLTNEIRHISQRHFQKRYFVLKKSRSYKFGSLISKIIKLHFLSAFA